MDSCKYISLHFDAFILSVTFEKSKVKKLIKSMAVVRQKRWTKLQNVIVSGYIRDDYKNFPDDLASSCYKYYLREFCGLDIDTCNPKLNTDVMTGIIEAKYYNKTDFVNVFGSIIKKGNVETWHGESNH